MLSRLVDVFRRKKRVPHPYEDLRMGRIKVYSLIISKTELTFWLNKGWVEVPDFRGFHYIPDQDETVVLSRPLSILDANPDSLIGRRILGYSSSVGTYGMGGPGFLGFMLSHNMAHNHQTETTDGDILVYGVYSAGSYTLIDNRIVKCHPSFYNEFHPWMSNFADGSVENWDDLTPILVGCSIDTVQLHDDTCIITATGESGTHVIEFLKNDPRLPPFGSGSPRTNAFDTGIIGEYIVLQKEGALLHVY